MAEKTIKMTTQAAVEIVTSAIQTECMTVEQDRALAVVQKAVEKQIPKKPEKSDSRMFYICPCCRRFVQKNEQSHGNIDIKFCKWCGQAFDWEAE